MNTTKVLKKIKGFSWNSLSTFRHKTVEYHWCLCCAYVVFLNLHWMNHEETVLLQSFHRNKSLWLFVVFRLNLNGSNSSTIVEKRDSDNCSSSDFAPICSLFHLSRLSRAETDLPISCLTSSHLQEIVQTFRLRSKAASTRSRFSCETVRKQSLCCWTRYVSMAGVTRGEFGSLFHLTLCFVWVASVTNGSSSMSITCCHRAELLLDGGGVIDVHPRVSSPSSSEMTIDQSWNQY